MIRLPLRDGSMKSLSGGSTPDMFRSVSGMSTPSLYGDPSGNSTPVAYTSKMNTVRSKQSIPRSGSTNSMNP